MKKKILAVSLLLAGFACLPARADITVGVLVGATGPGASLGIPYKNTFSVLPATLGGEKVRYIILDDGTDPSTAVKNARKLISEDNVDVLVGSSSVPTATAVVEVANELKTPQIALSPVAAPPNKLEWTFPIPQPVPVMMEVVVEHMKAHKVKTVAYIGFSDSWGDLVYKGFVSQAEPAGISVIANERFARTDTSVTAQTLKIIGAHPDAVVAGGSGTPGTLPHLALVERGYKGPIYHNHGVINRDFLRVGGKNIEHAMAPTGPVMVAEQLPDSNPIKKVALEFTKLYEAAYGAGSRNAFAAYSYDAYLRLEQAVPVALKKAKPGTPEFRAALRAALENAKEVVGTHAVYNTTPADHNGVDRRSRVLVEATNGDWKLVK
ncbi:MAG: ABC transporter substrate-binding protein [Sulfuritalea sp.]|jgi:branched-chain amino acid transport system substrate-binding protein|nr:ABC transporter substrate-binding protein [Sulfuritalea sp.]